MYSFCKRVSLSRGFSGCLTACSLFLLGIQGCYRWYSIRPVLNRISPGMSYERVITIIPQRHIRSTRIWDSWVPSNAYFAHTNAQVCSHLYITSVITLFTPDEVAFIYFDREDCVTGVYYNTSSGNRFWKPKWARRIDR